MITEKNEWNLNDVQRIVDTFSIGKLSKFDIVVNEEVLMMNVYRQQQNLLLLGIKTGNADISSSHIEELLAKYLDLHLYTEHKTHDGYGFTHKFGRYWFLIEGGQPLTLEKTQGYLDKLAGMSAHLEEGYGGVLFGEFGTLELWNNGAGQTRIHGSHRFFSDEYWEIFHKGKKVTDRWFSDKTLIESFPTMTLVSATLRDNGKQTELVFSNGYTIVVYRGEELTTWHLDLREKHQTVRLNGDKTFRLVDYQDPTWFAHPKAPLPKTNEPDPITKSYYKEDLPLSVHSVRILLEPLPGAVVQEVTMENGISFSLELMTTVPWTLSVRSSWELYAHDKKILDSRSNRFHFIDELEKRLLGKKLLSLTLDDKGKTTELVFSSSLRLVLHKDRHYSAWWISCEGIHISNLRTGFTHLIVCPDEKLEQYHASQQGEYFAHLMYALDVYRRIV